MSDTTAAIISTVMDASWMVLILFVVIIFIGVCILLIFKNRHKIFANAWLELFGVNEQGNVLSRRILPGKIDKDNKMKEITVKDIEETLSIENCYPLKVKNKDLYFACQYPDGKIDMINPSLFNQQFKFDAEFLDYKRWYSYIIPTLYENLHKDEVEKATRKILIMTVAAIIGACIITGVAVYFAAKLGTFSVSEASRAVQASAGTIKALTQNITFIK